MKICIDREPNYTELGNIVMTVMDCYLIIKLDKNKYSAVSLESFEVKNYNFKSPQEVIDHLSSVYTVKKIVRTNNLKIEEIKE